MSSSMVRCCANNGQHPIRSFSTRDPRAFKSFAFHTMSNLAHGKKIEAEREGNFLHSKVRLNA
jgi:hypothetical protein